MMNYFARGHEAFRNATSMIDTFNASLDECCEIFDEFSELRCERMCLSHLITDHGLIKNTIRGIDGGISDTAMIYNEKVHGMNAFKREIEKLSAISESFEKEIVDRVKSDYEYHCKMTRLIDSACDCIYNITVKKEFSDIFGDVNESDIKKNLSEFDLIHDKYNKQVVPKCGGKRYFETLVAIADDIREEYMNGKYADKKCEDETDIATKPSDDITECESIKYGCCLDKGLMWIFNNPINPIVHEYKPSMNDKDKLIILHDMIVQIICTFYR